jgi:hypothetical protein
VAHHHDHTIDFDDDDDAALEKVSSLRSSIAGGSYTKT